MKSAPVRPVNRLFPVVFAVALGIIAVLAVRQYIRKSTEASGAERTVTLIYAKRDITRGTTVADDMVEIRQAPVALLDAQAVKESDRPHLIGNRASIKIPKGQPMLWSAMEIAADSSFAGKIEPNMRAVTISLDGPVGDRALIQPGDRVDIVCTYSDGIAVSGLENSTTKMLLQDLLVLAVDSVRTNNLLGSLPLPNTGPGTGVTLKASPEEAILLVHADQKTQLTLLLRNPQDLVTSTYPTVTRQTIARLGGAGFVDERPEAAENAAPVPGFPVIYQQGRSVGSGFYVKPDGATSGGQSLSDIARALAPSVSPSSVEPPPATPVPARNPATEP